MNFKTLVRDRKRVLDSLSVRPDRSVITKTGCTIYFPTRFVDRSLAEIGVSNLCIGLFPIVIEEKYYSLVSVNSMIHLEPSEITKTSYEDTEYYELHFPRASVVIQSLTFVKDDVVLYRLYDELFSKGKIPWYIGYEDLGKLYDTAAKFAGSSVGSNPEVIQLLTSLITRNKYDRAEYYRTVVKNRRDLVDNPPVFIPLKSVFWAATNTVNKLAGSYFSDGVTSALLNPSSRVEPIEAILRA